MSARDDRDSLREFGMARIARVRDLCAENRHDEIGPALVLAMGLRESNLRNIVGDYGNGRGFLQIDDRWHPDFLNSVPGCRSGEWSRVYDSALPKGRVPPLAPMTRYAIGLLHSNVAYGRQNDVKGADLIRFAVAAYNCGPGNALKGYREGNVDRYTAWGNYSKDVLARKSNVREYLREIGGDL